MYILCFEKFTFDLSDAGLRRATSFVVDNYLLVRIELVPELQTLLINYESMSKRLAVLEQVKSKLHLFSPSTRYHSHSRFAFM
jgi:hypothetical protein